jgi:hypothetical protein
VKEVLFAIPVGIIATAAMDLERIIVFGVPVPAGDGKRRNGPYLLGRWVCYMFKGQFRHADITQSPPLRAEGAVGWVVHYLIGWNLALTYFFLLDLTGLSATLPAAVIYGACTTVFAWLLMLPAWGMGWFGTKSKMTFFSLVNHIAFGFGLFVGTLIFNPLS